MRAYATAIGLPSNTIHSIGNANTDWQDQIYRTAASTDHRFSAVGGTKHMPYRASLGFTLNNGTIKNQPNATPNGFRKPLTINL